MTGSALTRWELRWRENFLYKGRGPGRGGWPSDPDPRLVDFFMELGTALFSHFGRSGAFLGRNWVFLGRSWVFLLLF